MGVPVPVAGWLESRTNLKSWGCRGFLVLTESAFGHACRRNVPTPTAPAPVRSSVDQTNIRLGSHELNGQDMQGAAQPSSESRSRCTKMFRG
jgi:hypothetical protein